MLATVLGRWERRAMLVAALGIAALGNALSAVEPTYPLLVAARVVTALGAAVYTPGATLVATQLSPPERRGRAVAAVFGGLTVSLVIGVPAGTVLGGPLGYGAGALIGNHAGGLLADRFGSHRPLAWILPAMTVVLATMPLTSTTVVGAGPALFALGAGWMVNAPLQSRLIELSPGGSALVLSFNAAAIYLGAGIAGSARRAGGRRVRGAGAARRLGRGVYVATLGLLVLVLRQRPAPVAPSAPG